MLTRSDKILIFGLLTFACFLFIRPFFASSEVNEVLIKVGDGAVQKLSLRIDRKIAFEGEKGRVVVQVKDGKVRIVESSCFQKICVNTGWIDKASQNIICLPNRVLVTIEAKGSSKVDAVSY